MDDIDISLAVKALILRDHWLASHATVVVNRLPQGVKGDSICLWIASEVPFNALDKAIGLDQARIQLDSYGVEPATAGRIGRRLWQYLDGFSGVADGVFIKGASRLTGVRQRTDRVLVGTDQYRYIATQDFLFTYDSLVKVTA